MSPDTTLYIKFQKKSPDMRLIPELVQKLLKFFVGKAPGGIGLKVNNDISEQVTFKGNYSTVTHEQNNLNQIENSQSQ